MTMLIIVSSVHWGQTGVAQLKANWEHGRTTTDTSASSVARQIYYGICLGMLGLTGFECKPEQPFLNLCLVSNNFPGTPSYISRIKPGKFPLVLRNLHIPAIILNSTIMLLLLAVVPLDVILSGANVLSVLAQTVSPVRLSHFASPLFCEYMHIIILTFVLKSSPEEVGFEHGLLSMQSSSSVEEF